MQRVWTRSCLSVYPLSTSFQASRACFQFRKTQALLIFLAVRCRGFGQDRSSPYTGFPLRFKFRALVFNLGKFEFCPRFSIFYNRLWCLLRVEQMSLCCAERRLFGILVAKIEAPSDMCISVRQPPVKEEVTNSARGRDRLSQELPQLPARILQ